MYLSLSLSLSLSSFLPLVSATFRFRILKGKFISVAVHLLGASEGEALLILRDTGRRITSVVVDPRSFQLLMQRLNVAEKWEALQAQ
jgi:hypothetical protein